MNFLYLHLVSSNYINDEPIVFPDYCGADTYEGVFDEEEAKNKKCVIFHDYLEFNTTMFQNNNIIRWMYLPSTNIIKEGSFADSLSIETIISPKLNEIERYSFAGCNKLLEMSVPNLSIIRMSAFENCTSLKVINTTSLTVIEPFAFKSCKLLSTIDLSVIEEISDEAFAESGITKVTAENVQKIGTAFHFLPNLLSISIPKVTELQYNAFSACASLQSISAENLVKLAMSAFTGCSSLKTISLPKATSLGDYAFADCTSLESIDAPLMEEIGQGAFSNSGLQKLSMPLLKTIGDFAFSMCQSLSEIDIPLLALIPESAFAFSAFKSANFSKVLELEGDMHFMSSSIEILDLRSLQKADGNAKAIFNSVANLSAVRLGCQPPHKLHNTTFSKNTKVIVESESCIENYKNETVTIDGKLFYAGGQLVSEDENPSGQNNKTTIYITCGVIGGIIIIIILITSILCFRKKKTSNLPGVSQENLLQ